MIPDSPHASIADYCAGRKAYDAGRKLDTSRSVSWCDGWYDARDEHYRDIHNVPAWHANPETR